MSSSSSTSTNKDKSLSSMDAFSKVDNLVSKPVLGSDGAASWQSFRKDHQSKRQSVAPKAPLKKADKLGTGLSSWDDERKLEDEIRHSSGHATTGSGYTTFKKKNNAEEAAERKRMKLIESKTRPDDKPYHIPSKTFQGWRFDYIFTTRLPDYSTGYFWDGMDSIKKYIRGEDIPEPSPEIQETKSTKIREGDKEKEQPKKKKRKKLSGPVIVHDPNNPLEQVAAVIQQRNQLLNGGSDPSIPPGWEVAKDPFTGKPYYFNRSTGERSWEKPVHTTTTTTTTNTNTTGSDEQEQNSKRGANSDEKPLPDGWQSVPDKQTGKTYYYHQDGRTRWDRPS